MASAKITLLGLYKWDNTLFQNLTLPTGIDKNLFIDSLMLRGGEFEVLYPDPDFMKDSISVWGSKWYRTFSEWLRGTQESFNPIYNYDRFEDNRDEHRKQFSSTTTADYTDSRTANLEDKRTADLEEKRTADLTDERTADLSEETTFDNSDTTSQVTDQTTEHTVAAYDSSNYEPSSKDTINNGSSKIEHAGTVTNATTGTDTMAHTGTDTVNTTGTDTINHTGTDKTNHKGTLSDVGGSESNTNIHTAHMYGNIGVTTSAAMLREFYDISVWNLYEHMCDVFVSELLIPVY